VLDHQLLADILEVTLTHFLETVTSFFLHQLVGLIEELGKGAVCGSNVR
jgi:hypothetical protein